MLRTGRNRVIAARDRCLRRAVQVREGRVRQARHPIPQGGGGKDLATPQEPPQSRKVIEPHDIELGHVTEQRRHREPLRQLRVPDEDRKSTRLNSSHGYISYAVFCLKKKKNKHKTLIR